MARINTALAAIMIAGGGILCALSLPVAAQNVPDNTNGAQMVNRLNSGLNSAWSAADMRFANDAAMGGMLEVELGRIAIQNAHSDRVKEFGQRMIDDHTKINNQLMAIAQKYNMTLPAALDEKQQKTLDQLSRMNGRPFDDQYMTDMVRDHTKDVEDFQKEIPEGTNGDLKNFATATLPTIQDQLRMARSVQNALTAEAQKETWGK